MSPDFSQINYPTASTGGGLLTNEMFPASAKPLSSFPSSQSTTQSLSNIFGTSRTKSLLASATVANAPAASARSTLGPINTDKTKTDISFTSGTTTLTHNGLTWTLIEKDGYKIL